MINLKKTPITPLVNVGLMIEKYLDENGIGRVEMARTLNMSRSNVYRILSSPSIHTDTLIRISRGLKHDFLKDLSEKTFPNEV